MSPTRRHGRVAAPRRKSPVISVVLRSPVRDAGHVSKDDPDGLVRASIERGLALETIAALLRDEGVSPIEAAKALRRGAGIHLGEAKVLVDRTLPHEWRRENDQLRAIAEEAILSED